MYTQKIANIFDLIQDHSRLGLENKFAMSVKKLIRSKLTGAPNENKVQNHLNIAVLNVF